jgi:TolB-like protein
LREHRAAADPLIAQHGGRVFKMTGDGLLIEFGSVVGAVECALGLQRLAEERNTAVASERQMEWRIGVHLGDVLIEGEDILGDGVNIAARLEGIAEPGGICISDDAFRQVRGKVEVEFADLGEQTLKNIARPLRVYSVRPASPSEPRIAPTASLPLPDKPSIAVLPFANMSGDPEQEYFADGMVEEIITALSRIRWLFVIARNSTFTYKGQAVDVKRVGRELGVRYVLEGSVRKAGQRVRITGQLIDATTGAHLWADRFDGTLEDVFDLQDQVATSVAGVIEPALEAAEIRRAAGRPTSDLAAYDLYLRALPAMYSFSKEGIFTGLSLLERAIAHDPTYAQALGAAANCCMHLDLNGWSENPEHNRESGVDYGRRALVAAGEDPEVLAIAAVTLAYHGDDIGTMIRVIDRALALNAAFARGWYLSGVVRLWAGDPDDAIERVKRSITLSPRASVGSQLSYIGAAYLMKRQFSEAEAYFLMAIQERPSNPNAYRGLAACFAHMGRRDEARQVVVRLREFTPIVVPSASYFRNAEHRELYLSGLRLAAGETL